MKYNLQDEPLDNDKLEYFFSSSDQSRFTTLKFTSQIDEVSCGIACLKMITDFYKNPLTQLQIRKYTDMTKDGVTLFSLRKSANHIGFSAKGVKLPVSEFSNMQMPFIATTRFHYIVVYKVNKKKGLIYYADPASGLMSKTINEFQKEYQDIALLLKPTKLFYKTRPYGENSLDYFKLLTGEKLSFVYILLALLIQFILNLTTPFYFQFIFDYVIPQKAFQIMLAASTIYFSLILIAIFTSHIRKKIFIELSVKINLRLTDLFIRKLFKLPLSYFSTHSAGDIISRYTELGEVKNFLVNDILDFFISLGVVLIYSLILYNISPSFILIIISSAFLSLLTETFFGKMISSASDEHFNTDAREQSFLFEVFNGHSTLYFLNAFSMIKKRWESKFRLKMDKHIKRERLIALANSINVFLDNFFTTVFIFVSSVLYFRNEITIGQLLTINIISQQLLSSLLNLFSLRGSLFNLGISVSKINDIVLSEQDNISSKLQFESDDSGFKLKLNNLSYQFGSELSPHVLKNINFIFYTDKTYGIFGLNGSGKTTLAKILACHYAPTDGNICFNKKDFVNSEDQNYREIVSYVGRDDKILPGNLLQIISNFEKSPSHDKFIKAIHIADLEDFISTLPKKEETLIRDSNDLSSGQIQKLNIARAIYRDTSINIFDESTSSIDPISEHKIFSNLKDTNKNKLNIIISHRKEVVNNLDEILFLDNGVLFNI